MSVPPQRDRKSVAAIPHLEAAIRQVRWLSARAGQCATWQDPNDAVVAIIIWNGLCLFFWTIVIYAIPALLLLWTTRTWPSPDDNDNTKVPLANSLSDTTDTPSIDIVVDWLAAADRTIQSFLDALDWSKNPARTRRTFILLIYFYVFWVAAHQIADTRYILAAAGTLFVTWQSPWLVQLREAGRYPISIFTAVFLDPLQEVGISGLMQRALTHQENVMRRVSESADFTFVLVENQRSLGHWQSTSLSFDRAPWTDESNQPVASKAAFALPSPLLRPATKDADYQNSWSWQWIDTEWQLEQSSRTDELGWEYGTMMWTMFDRTPKGIASTRRRRWVRRATLEYRVEAPTSPSPQKHILTRIQVPSLTPTNNASPQSQHGSEALVQSHTTLHHHANAPLSPTGHFVDGFTTPVTSPRTSISFNNKPDCGRRDTFGNHRQSQSTTIIASEPGHIRQRATSLYSNSRTDTLRSLDKLPQSSTNVSRDNKRPREAVWKSIVRN